MSLTDKQKDHIINQVGFHLYNKGGSFNHLSRLTPEHLHAASAHELSLEDSSDVLNTMKSNGHLNENFGKVKLKEVPSLSEEGGDGDGAEMGEDGAGKKKERDTVVRELRHHIPTHGMTTGAYQAVQTLRGISKPAFGQPADPIGSVIGLWMSTEYALRGRGGFATKLRKPKESELGLVPKTKNGNGFKPEVETPQTATGLGPKISEPKTVVRL